MQHMISNKIKYMTIYFIEASRPNQMIHFIKIFLNKNIIPRGLKLHFG